MAVFVGSGGTVLGETVDYVPAKGITVTAPTKTSSVTTDSAVSSSLISAAATTANAVAGGFNITLDFSGGGLSASQQSIFSTAAARWEKVLTGDLPDVAGVDDIKITATGKVIDGVGTILGQAGYTALRSGTSLPYLGTMAFDSADLASMESNGSLLDVITHEMGHVLGIGSLWSRKGLIAGAGTTSSRFVGTNALAEYRRFTGDASASSIPVETDGGPGTADAHWDDSTFGNELMTGYLSGGANPLSRMSAASLIDMGYPLVNVDAADLYTLSNALPVVGTLSAPGTTALGSTLALTLSSASDADGVGSISFYRETNGIPGLQATGTVASDMLIVTNAGANGLAQVSTSGWSTGNYTFYARATDSRGAYSAVATTTANVVASAATPTPAAPDLLAASDTGVSDTDDLTAKNRPTFTGTAAASATVSIFADGALVGTATADAAGAYSFTPATALSDGRHTITVTATAPGSTTSGTSAGLTITVDTEAPAPPTFRYDREQTQRITLTFADRTAVESLSAEFATLSNETTGQAVAISILSTDATAGLATLGANGLLANGKYVLTLSAGGIHDRAGNAMAAEASFAFTQLTGDVTGDGVVNFSDLLALAKRYNTAGNTASSGNVDYSADGVVNFNDLLLLAKGYGTSIDGTGSIQSAATSSAGTTSSLLASVTQSTTPITTTRSRRTASPFLG